MFSLVFAVHATLPCVLFSLYRALKLCRAFLRSYTAKPSGAQEEIYNFSKIYIKKIISAEEWGISPLKQREFYHNRTPVKFNYFDYIEAFNKVLLYENDKRKHSWFLKINA